MNNKTRQKSYQSLVESEEMYRQIIEFSTETIIIHTDYKVLYINQSGADFLRASKEDIVGARVLDIILEGNKKSIEKRIQQVVSKNEPAGRIEQTITRLDGTLVDVEIYCYPIIFDNVSAIHTVMNDITERRKIKKEVIEVSAPIVPLLDDIAVLPIVGSMDSERAIHLLEIIPSKVKEQNVLCLIIDLSGIYNFDEMTTNYLFKISSVLKLLGVHTIITGIRPELALTASRIGVDLTSLKTFATVKQALSHLGIYHKSSISNL